MKCPKDGTLIYDEQSGVAEARVSLFAKTFIGDALSVKGSVDVSDLVEWFLVDSIR